MAPGAEVGGTGTAAVEGGAGVLAAGSRAGPLGAGETVDAGEAVDAGETVGAGEAEAARRAAAGFETWIWGAAAWGGAGTRGTPDWPEWAGLTVAESGADASLAVAAAGKRTICWHLGHLTLRPKTSVGTVNVAEQLGQSTDTLDMVRVLAAFPNRATPHDPNCTSRGWPHQRGG